MVRTVLLTVSLPLALAACAGGGELEATEIEKRLPRRVMDAPSDSPDWSQSSYVRWASLKVADERALIIDVPGGEIDSLLDHEDVTAILNADFRSIFLHPRARPALTGRLGWPSITLMDEQGCLRATGQPTTAEGIVALLKEGLQAQQDDVERPLPAWRDDVPSPPEGGGEWTQDNPEKAGLFANPERGAPAVLIDGKPYLYGNREDAELLRDTRPAAEAFLETLPANHSYLSSEGPVITCPLPIPPRPTPTEGDQGEAANEDTEG